MITEDTAKGFVDRHGSGSSQAGNTRPPGDGINKSPDALIEYLRSRDVEVERQKAGHDGGVVLVLSQCPMNPEHGKATDTAVILLSNGKIGFKCHHNGCADYKWSDVRKRIDPDYMTRATTKPKLCGRPKSGVSSAVGSQHEPFPTKLLPEPLRAFVVEGARSIGCALCFFALPVLASIAAAIGTTRRIRLKRDWAEPAIVWTGIIGDSGSLKSPALEHALEPIRRVQNEAFKRYMDEQNDYDKSLTEYEADVHDWKRAGKKKGEPAPTKPEAPVAERFVVADITVEALATILANNPRGLLLARDELAAFFKSFDAYKGGRGGDVAVWLELHRCGTLTVDRKTGDRKTIHIPRASVCIAGSIQPQTLARVLAREHFEDGLAARILLSMPPRRTKRWTSDEISTRTRDAYANTICALLELRHNISDEGDPCPVDVPLSADGQREWVRFYDEFAAEQAELPGGALAAVASKLEGYAARFALLFHLVRWVASDPTLVDPKEIDASSVRAGASLSRWFLREAVRVYAILEETEEETEDRRLVEYVHSHGGRITARELARRIRRYAKSEDARQALNRLTEAGIGEWQIPPTDKSGGRPTQVFVLHPRADETRDSESADSADTDKTPPDAAASAGIVGACAVGAPENDSCVGAHPGAGKEAEPLSPPSRASMLAELQSLVPVNFPDPRKWARKCRDKGGSYKLTNPEIAREYWARADRIEQLAKEVEA